MLGGLGPLPLVPEGDAQPALSDGELGVDGHGSLEMRQRVGVPTDAEQRPPEGVLVIRFERRRRPRLLYDAPVARLRFAQGGADAPRERADGRRDARGVCSLQGPGNDDGTAARVLRLDRERVTRAPRGHRPPHGDHPAPVAREKPSPELVVRSVDAELCGQAALLWPIGDRHGRRPPEGHAEDVFERTVEDRIRRSVLDAEDQHLLSSPLRGGASRGGRRDLLRGARSRGVAALREEARGGEPEKDRGDGDDARDLRAASPRTLRRGLRRIEGAEELADRRIAQGWVHFEAAITTLSTWIGTSALRVRTGAGLL